MEIRQRYMDHGAVVLNEDFVPIFGRHGLVTAQAIWNMEDRPVKAQVPERRTGSFLLRDEKGGQCEFFIKRYWPLPAAERIKALFSLKWEKHSGLHEWRAQILFHKHLLPTLIPVAAGRSGRNSFNITLGMKNYRRASELFADKDALSPDNRKALIERIGLYAARMHKKGLAHQDLYLVHFFVKLPDLIPYLIDLQRVVIQERLRRRWAVKDIAQLLFSSKLVLSDQEISHLLDSYCHELGFDIRQDRRLFREIEKKAARMMKRHERKKAPTAGGSEG